MKYVNLINKDNPDEVIKWYIPEGGYDTDTGRIDFTGDYYEDYFPDCVDEIYSAFGSDIAFRTQIMRSANGTDPSYSNTNRFYWEEVNNLCNYARIFVTYKTRFGLDSYQDWDSSFDAKYWYLEGSDPQTRRYVRFTDARTNTSNLNWTIYKNDLTALSGASGALTAYGGGNSVTSFKIPSIYSWSDFIEAASANDSHTHQSYCQWTTSSVSASNDPVTGQTVYKVPIVYYGFGSGRYYDWLWYLYKAGDPDDPGDDDPRPVPDDPYDPYDPSGPGAPVPPSNPYDPGDDINIPTAPGWNPSDSGFLKIFIPSTTTLGQLAAKLWDNNFFVTLLKDFISDPRDGIISLGCVPFDVTPSGSAEIKVGSFGTGISSAYVDSPYVDIDCGTVNIPAILGGYTDFTPFTDMYLYLPYIGSVQLDTDIYMAQTVGVKYRCDILTGDCVAFVLVGSNVKAVYNGNIRFGVPITSGDYSNMWNTFLSTTAGALMGVAGAAAAGAEAGAVDMVTGAVKGGVGKLSQSAGIKPQIQITGQLQSTNGLLGIQKPYIEIRRPNLCIPADQRAIEGYPSLISQSIGSCVGYTEVEEVHLSIPGATREELEEIERLLKEGVLL